MKNGDHILKSKEERNFRTCNSKFTADYAFGYKWAKFGYWKRDPIWILEKRFSALLGNSFANFIYGRLIWKFIIK